MLRLAASLLAASLFVAVLFGLRWVPALLLTRDIAEGCAACGNVEREPVSWTTPAGTRREADAYTAHAPGNPGRRDGPDRGGLLLVPGASPGGRDEPRFIAFAQAFARAGYTVLTPEIANLRALQIRAGDVDAVADAVERLHAVTGPVGIAAVSYAAAPVLLAALEPRLAGKVRFVLAIGGYHDAVATLTWFTTGAYREGPGAPWRRGEPNAYGRWVFVRNNAALLDDPADRTSFEAMAARKFRDLDAPIDDLVAGLGPQGRLVQAVLDNRDPDAVPGLVARLPPAIRAEIAALDPSRADLAHFPARVILVHGRDDAIIPWTESAALARALPPGHARLFLIDRLAHVELRLDSLDDVWQIVAAVEAVLRASRP